MLAFFAPIQYRQNQEVNIHKQREIPAVAAFDQSSPAADGPAGWTARMFVVSPLAYCSIEWIRDYSDLYEEILVKLSGGSNWKGPADLTAEATQLALEPSNQVADYRTNQNITDKHDNTESIGVHRCVSRYPYNMTDPPRT